MIKTYTQVPEYYYKESRDFQLLGRIFEAVFNHSKMAIDTLANNPLSRNSDIALMDLVTKTIGFESHHTYDIPNLMALVNSFKSILKIKGTKKSIEDCVRILLNAQNIYEKFDVIISTSRVLNPGTPLEEKIEEMLVTIYIPQEVRDVSLLEDMLDYVLPAGFNYSIIIASINPETVGAEAISVDSIQFNTNSEGQINYTDESLGIITPGLVTLSLGELNNIEDKGVVDNAVIVKPEAPVVD